MQLAHAILEPMTVSSAELLVIGLFVVPVLLLVLLRVNAALVFLSLCLGYVLTQFLMQDTKALVDLFLPHTSVGVPVLRIALLVLPAAVTMLFMFHTVKGSKLVLNIAPAAAAGSLLVLLVVPLLSPGLYHSVTMMPAWHLVARSESLIIGGGALLTLLFVWLQRPHKSGDERGKKH